MRPFHVYLLRCGDGSYYCGHTDNLETRMQQHGEGVIGYTAGRKPVTLVWHSECERREEALAFEQQIKGWSRAKKEALIEGNWMRISELSRTKGSAPVHPALRQAQGERGDTAAIGGERGGTAVTGDERGDITMTKGPVR